MLVHVFDTLLQEEKDTAFFPNFLKCATKATKVDTIIRDGEYLVIEGFKRSKKKGVKKRKRFKVEWPSGILYQKLRGTSSKQALPIIWRMCRYYYSGAEDISSLVVRNYLKSVHKVVLERSPFCLEASGVLSTGCHFSKASFPDELNSDQVTIVVDKQSFTVILLPHRRVAQTLLLLLKEFL